MAKDVCAVLGLANVSKAIADHVDAMDKSNVSLGLRGSPVNIVNESGLYTLIMRSNKQEARAFQRWVTNEVLPTIRKTGGAYLTPAKAEELLADPKLIIGLAQQVIELQELRNQAEIARYEAVAQRDEAIRTKACISDRKTATAMQTAGALRKKVNKLEMQLGVSETYMTARAIPWLAEYFGKKMSRGAWVVVGQQLKCNGCLSMDTFT